MNGMICAHAGFKSSSTAGNTYYNEMAYVCGTHKLGMREFVCLRVCVVFVSTCVRSLAASQVRFGNDKGYLDYPALKKKKTTTTNAVKSININPCKSQSSHDFNASARCLLSLSQPDGVNILYTNRVPSNLTTIAVKRNILS